MSFNRNQKRVAGPGFHVNVRYDDNQVARMRQQIKVAPFLAQGARLAEIHDVKEQELLVTLDHEKGKSAHYFDGYTHAFSAVNGWSNTADIKDFDRLKEHILGSVKFVGVATTEFIPKPGFQEQGFVSQVGGVVTLVNESTTDIHPGDSVKLDLNLSYQRGVVREKGIPREKVRFTVARAETSGEILDKAIKEVGVIGGAIPDAPGAQAVLARAQAELDAANDAQNNVDDDASAGDKARAQQRVETAQRAFDQATREVALCGTGDTRRQLKAIIKKVNEYNQRIIGRACSFARKGDRLEVLLQPRNPY